MTLDDDIKMAIYEHGPLTVREIIRTLYPDKLACDFPCISPKINRHCNKLHKDGHLTKTDTDDGIKWGLARCRNACWWMWIR